MKNLNFTFKLLAIIFVISISSCSTRQMYTYNNFNKSKFTKSKIIKSEKSEKPVAVTEIVPEADEIKIPKTEVEIQTILENDVANTATANSSVVSKKRKKSVHQSVQTPLNSTVKIPKKLNKVIQKMELTESNRDDRNNSLFWTVMIVILILWLLGLLSGSFGGLIHLLLVILLIVIILRLLGF